MSILIKDLMLKRNNFCLSIDNLEIERGSKVGIIGLNGSGKTTFFDCLLGFLKYQGYIKILGMKPKTDFKKLAPQVSYCMQNPDDQLFCSTIRDDILFAARNFKIQEDESSILERINKLIDVSDFLHRAPFELSYGEKKKCVIASMLTTNPKILIFDEPTAMLDVKQKKSLTNIIKNIKDTTMLVSTHDFEWIHEFCDKLMILKNGQKIYYGDKDVLKDEEFLSKIELF